MKKLLMLIAACGTLAGSLHAQGPGAPNAGANAALIQLFGKHAFTAKSEIQMTPSDGARHTPGLTGAMTMAASTAAAEGNVRTEVDMTAIKGGQFPPQALAGLKSMGMDRVVTIVNSSKKTMLIVYPGLSGYVEMPMPDDEARLAGSKLSIEKSELGREQVAGQDTIKQRVIMKDGDTVASELTIWTAPALKDFPVRVEMTEAGNLVQITYSDVKLERPPSGLFEAPAGFTKHSNLMSLMQSGAARMIRPPGQ